MSRLQSIPIASIEVREDRARGIDLAWAEGLAGIIDAEGLIQPIAVIEIGEKLTEGEKDFQPLFRLVAGGHRLAACKSLGWEEISAQVYPDDFGNTDLIETLENLARRELTALDKAKHFARFKSGYEAKHGPIQPGPNANSPRNGLIAEGQENQSPRDGLWSFHEVIAERTGFKRASIFDYLAIWNGLAPNSYERLRALDHIAGNKGQLKQLSEQSHDRQEQALGLIETDPKITTVGDALNALDGIERQPIDEKKITVARGAWTRLNQEQRFEFLSGCEDEVRQYAIQKGWINV